MKPLSGKVALVTGGTRGVGAAVTRKLVEWGATVTAGYVDRESSARKLVAELGSAVQVVCADVTNPDEVSELVTQAATEDRIDIVVHCAAAAAYGSFSELTKKQWDFTQNTSLTSLRLVALAARPFLANGCDSRLIAVTNTMPHRIIPQASALAVAKAGVETLTSYLAYEFAADNIVVNAVQPGLVPTEVMAVRPDYELTMQQERNASPWPQQHTTSSADVANVIAALCLPEMSWVAGQVIAVDGGSLGWGWLGNRHG